VEQHRFKNGAQAAGAGLSLHGAMRDSAQRLLTELELRAFHVEQAAVLLRESVLRLGQNGNERGLVELIERCHHRQTTDELGDEAVLDEIFGLHVVEQICAMRALARATYLGGEADAALLSAVQDHLLEASECSTADEQDVLRIDLQEFLLRMLATALRRNRS